MGKIFGTQSIRPVQCGQLYYGVGNADAKVAISKDAAISEIELNGTNTINEAIVNETGAVNSVTMTFNCPTR